MVKKPARTIVGAIVRAAARWNNPRFARRIRTIEAIQERTGYPTRWIEQAFDSIFSRLTQEGIESVIEDELGSLDVLDGFVQRPRGFRARALPLGRICVISSRTTIGVAIVPSVFALCAKCEVLVKDREDRLVAAFFETLADELEDFRSAARAKIWRGENGSRDLRGFDGVVAFGNDASLREIAASLQVGTRFVPYGSKASAGYVTRETLHSETKTRAAARDAAHDLLLFETEGCLSLHVLFVERGGALSPARFSAMVSAAIRSAHHDLPVAAGDRRRTARVAAARDLALFSHSDAGSVHSDPQSTYLVALDPPGDVPPFFLPRSLMVRSVDSPSELTAYLRRHGISLEALAIAGSRSDVTIAAEETGASRITALGAMQDPPLGTFHGGRPRIAEFVRWLTDERAIAES
jgi:Acyl-CoA reductase (LuxC)